MRPNELQPAAEVREYDETFGAIMKRAGAINQEFTRNDKDNLRRALQIGRALNRARPMAAIGEWEKVLEEQGISTQRASDFMWGANQPQDEQDSWQSTTDLRRSRADKSRRDKEGTPQLGSTPPTASTNPAAGAMSPPQKPENLCGSCQRKGWQAGCEDCAKLNKTLGGKKGTVTSTKGNGAGGGKGGGSKPPKNGAISAPFDLTIWNQAIGSLTRLLSTVGEAYQAKESKERYECQKRLNEFKEAVEAWHKKLLTKGKG